MFGRNVLGLQPVGECLLAKISALCVFYVMFISDVYLIISKICIFNVPICWIFVVHGRLFISFLLWHCYCLMHVVFMPLIFINNPLILRKDHKIESWDCSVPRLLVARCVVVYLSGIARPMGGWVRYKGCSQVWHV